MIRGVRCARSLVLCVLGVAGFPAVVRAAPTSAPSVAAGSSSSVNVGEVNAKSHRKTGGGSVPTAGQVLQSGQTVKVIKHAEIEAAGPDAGAAQVLSYAPGVSVSGYGSNGATKYSMSVNGIKQGWGGPSGGNIDDGSVSVTFDGVPMVDPATGLWQSPEINQMSMIQAVTTTYGPGDPKDRWYDNLGGQVNFIPLQPTDKAGGDIGTTYGSDQNRDTYFDLRTGIHDGYSAIIAGGFGSGNSFRDAPDGFRSPNHDYAWFGKLRKTLMGGGSLSIGGYTAKGTGYRPNVIPVGPIPGVTTNGFTASGASIPGPEYSQQTTGFYSALPYGIWNKQDSNKADLGYMRLKLPLDQVTSLHNLIWYQAESRLHFHEYNYEQGQPNLYEYNNPYQYAYGDKIYFEAKLPYNTVDVGGFFMTSKYNSRNAFYNPAFGGSATAPNANYRSDYWYQRNLAMFVQDDVRVLPTVDVTPGIRFINYQTSYYNNGTADFPGATGTNQAQLPNAATAFSKTEPSIDINWRVAPGLAIYANYAEAYRQPSNGGGGGPYQSILASSLQLEQGREYQMGLKWYVHQGHRLNHLQMGANWYDLRFSNQIIGVSSQTGNYLTSAFGSSDYRGINLYAEDDPLYNLHVFANAGLERARFANYVVGGVSYNGLPVSYVPKQTLNVGAYYHWYRHGTVYEPRLWYQYVGSQYLFSNLTSAPTDQKMGGYGLVNASFIATLHLHGLTDIKQIKMEITALNLLNKQYNEFEYISSGGYFVAPASAGAVLAYPGAPRMIYATLEAGF